MKKQERTWNSLQRSFQGSVQLACGSVAEFEESSDDDIIVKLHCICFYGAIYSATPNDVDQNILGGGGG